MKNQPTNILSVTIFSFIFLVLRAEIKITIMKPAIILVMFDMYGAAWSMLEMLRNDDGDFGRNKEDGWRGNGTHWGRWRRSDWSDYDDNRRPLDPSGLLARQEELGRWLSKRQSLMGSAGSESDPDAAKVASKQAELQSLLQQLYEAEAAVKMETSEVTRTQQVAEEAQQSLEEATNKVRMLSADLQAAQEGAAAAATRAHTAQLQLSAHDQLMFTARQRVDALSARMVAVQAELASAQQVFTLSNSTQHLEQQGRILDPELNEDDTSPPRGMGFAGPQSASSYGYDYRPYRPPQYKKK